MVLKRLGVTGGSGMVGRHLLALMQADGIECCATSRRRPEFLPPGSQWSAWDLREWKSFAELDRLFPGIEAVLHVGAIVPRAGVTPSLQELMAANMTATLCLAEWAKAKDMPMVFLSSSTVYADADRSAIKEDDLKGSSILGGFYGLTKLLAENILANLASDGLQATILRPSSIYGAGLAADKMVSHFLAQAAQGRTISLKAPVNDRVDLVHAHDVAGAMLASLRHEARGAFNIASGQLVSIAEIARACIAVAGKGQVKLPTEENGPNRVRFGLDCSAAREAFGFEPKIQLHNGLGMMLAGALIQYQ